MIKIPDDVYRAAKSWAEKRGVTVGEFIIETIRASVQPNIGMTDEEVTETLNRIYSENPSEPDPVLSELQWRSLDKEDW